MQAERGTCDDHVDDVLQASFEDRLNLFSEMNEPRRLVPETSTSRSRDELEGVFFETIRTAYCLAYVWVCAAHDRARVRGAPCEPFRQAWGELLFWMRNQNQVEVLCERTLQEALQAFESRRAQDPRTLGVEPLQVAAVEALGKCRIVDQELRCEAFDLLLPVVEISV